MVSAGLAMVLTAFVTSAIEICVMMNMMECRRYGDWNGIWDRQRR